MAKTAYVYPQPARAPAPVATPAKAPAKAPATGRNSQPAPDSATMAKAILGARIAQYVMNDPAIAGDWLALVALCRAGLDDSDGQDAKQTILKIAVGAVGTASEGSTVFGLPTATGVIRYPWWRTEFVTADDDGTSVGGGSGDTGGSTAGSAGDPAPGSTTPTGSVVVTGEGSFDPGSVEVTGSVDISGSNNGSWWPNLHIEVHAGEHSGGTFKGQVKVDP